MTDDPTGTLPKLPARASIDTVRRPLPTLRIGWREHIARWLITNCNRVVILLMPNATVRTKLEIVEAIDD